MMPSPQEYYIALDPADDFAAWLNECKQRVRTLVGPQRYLDDPPHATLYVASFDNPEDLIAAVDAVAGRGWSSLQHPLRGWHTFENDPSSGGHALVCELDVPIDAALRRLQNSIATAAAAHRNVAATLQRYESFAEQLGATERSNLADFGFPFVGRNWRPHLTVAAVRPDEWEPVRKSFVEMPPFGGEIAFPTVAVRSVATSESLLTLKL